MTNLMLLKELNRNPFQFFDDLDRQLYETSKVDSNLIENDGHYLFSLDVPGVGREDVSLSLKEDLLSISAKRNSYEYSHTIRLPQDIDTNKIDAYCENGVLSIIFAKKESSKAKSISLHKSKNEGAWGKLVNTFFPEKSLPEKVS